MDDNVIHLRFYIVPLLAAGGVGLLIAFLIWIRLAIRDYREERIKKLIRYAVLEFWDKATPAFALLFAEKNKPLEINWKERHVPNPEDTHDLIEDIHVPTFMRKKPLTNSDMKEKLEENGLVHDGGKGYKQLSDEEKSNLTTLGRKVKEGMKPWVPLHEREGSAVMKNRKVKHD